MNKIEYVLSEQQTAFQKASKEDIADCVDAAISYLFRRLDYNQFKRKLEKYEFEAKKVKEYISNDGYMMRNLKLYLLYIAHFEEKRNSKSTRVSFGVDREDKTILEQIRPVTVLEIKKLASKFPPMGQREFEKYVVGIFEEINVWVRKFVMRKMRFIMQTEKLQLEDLTKELLCKGIRGFYLMYPVVESKEHAVNIVKRTIHNQGINLIHHYTTQKNAKLIQLSPGTFEANTISFDSMEIGVKENIMPTVSEPKDVEIDIKSFMETCTPKQQKFIKILMGDVSVDFEEFIQSRSLTGRRREVERMQPESLMKIGFEFLDVKPAQGWKFIEELKSHFGAYRTAF